MLLKILVGSLSMALVAMVLLAVSQVFAADPMGKVPYKTGDEPRELYCETITRFNVVAAISMMQGESKEQNYDAVDAAVAVGALTEADAKSAKAIIDYYWEHEDSFRKLVEEIGLTPVELAQAVYSACMAQTSV